MENKYERKQISKGLARVVMALDTIGMTNLSRDQIERIKEVYHPKQASSYEQR